MRVVATERTSRTNTTHSIANSLVCLSFDIAYSYSLTHSLTQLCIRRNGSKRSKSKTRRRLQRELSKSLLLEWSMLSVGRDDRRHVFACLLASRESRVATLSAALKFVARFRRSSKGASELAPIARVHGESNLRPSSFHLDYCFISLSRCRISPVMTLNSSKRRRVRRGSGNIKCKHGFVAGGNTVAIGCFLSRFNRVESVRQQTYHCCLM